MGTRIDFFDEDDVPAITSVVGFGVVVTWDVWDVCSGEVIGAEGLVELLDTAAAMLLEELGEGVALLEAGLEELGEGEALLEAGLEELGEGEALLEAGLEELGEGVALLEAGAMTLLLETELLLLVVTLLLASGAGLLVDGLLIKEVLIGCAVSI